MASSKEVKEKYAKLEEKLKEGGKMKEVNVFYRVMKEEFKANVVQEKKFKGRRAHGFDGAPFNKSPINDNLDRVYFSVRLSKNKEKYVLPIESRYGTERIKIPIKQLVTDDHHMFFAWQYNTRHKFTASLVLVTESNEKAFKFCNEKLHKLDKKDNPILCLTDNAWKVHVNNKITLEVEIFVVGDIQLKDNWEWDTVKFKPDKKPPPMKDPGTEVPADEEVNNLTTAVKDKLTLKDEPSGPSSKTKTPPPLTDEDVEILTEAIEDKLSLNGGSSGTPSKQKANTTTTAKAEAVAVAAAGPVPATRTTPIAAASATPLRGKQASVKATTSRQLVFQEGDGDVKEHKIQSQHICEKCQKVCNSLAGLLSHQRGGKCQQQTETKN